MSAESLERALRGDGIDCVVEAQERLAVIVPGARGLDLSASDLRRRALSLLPAHGFTHLALELVGPPAVAGGAGPRVATGSDGRGGASLPRP